MRQYLEFRQKKKKERKKKKDRQKEIEKDREKIEIKPQLPDAVSTPSMHLPEKGRLVFPWCPSAAQVLLQLHGLRSKLAFAQNLSTLSFKLSCPHTFSWVVAMIFWWEQRKTNRINLFGWMHFFFLIHGRWEILVLCRCKTSFTD